MDIMKVRGRTDFFLQKVMDLKSFTQAIQQIADEKGIPPEKIIETIEMALAAAYKRDYGKRGQIVRASYDPVTHRVSMRQIKVVVDESMVWFDEEAEDDAEAALKQSAGRDVADAVGDFEEELEEGEDKKVRYNPEKHLLLEEARRIKPDVEPGAELEFPLPYQDEFGRIAAQTAKQVIIQRLVSGVVQRIEGVSVFVDIGRAVGLLPPEEQIPHERFRIGERVKALLIRVEKNTRGPGVFLSRSHPRLLKKLFELEVPEIPAGTVEIKAVAREPGLRSKVAAASHESSIDPVGSLVGQKGVRVSTVIQELAGEKIDIIEWSDDPEEFIAHALSPAKVVRVELDPERREASVAVPEEQLSLAIGRSGQNVRLAAKLTGWKIDVRPAEPLTRPDADSGAEAGQKGEALPEEKPSPEKSPAPEVLSDIGLSDIVSDTKGQT